jgi:protein-disulfide isomerase
LPDCTPSAHVGLAVVVCDQSDPLATRHQLYDITHGTTSNLDLVITVTLTSGSHQRNERASISPKWLGAGRPGDARERGEDVTNVLRSTMAARWWLRPRTGRIDDMQATEAPSGHTPEGGVLVGSDGARRRLVVFEDPQCPYCREFEERSGDLLRREVAAGAVAIEYRIRSFLGDESVRAANALAAAAPRGRFDELRRELFANQPPEQSGGFTTTDLLELGSRAGLTGVDFTEAVEQARYERWVREIEKVFAQQDPNGTPFALLDGRPVQSDTLYDPDRLGAVIRG